jgi:hypothetical protein
MLPSFSTNLLCRFSYAASAQRICWHKERGTFYYRITAPQLVKAKPFVWEKRAHDTQYRY